METLRLSPLRKLFHTVISLSKKDMDRRFAMANSSISPLQYWVLVMVQQKSITVNEIAKSFGVKPPTLTPVVEALDKAGYLKKENDTSDRRKMQLIITAKGQQLLKKIPFDEKKDALNSAFNKLTSPEQKQLLSLLQELISNFPTHD